MQIIGDNQVLLTEDLISQLPDDILVKMLSVLTLKEAAQTSVLSPRWRYLWTSHPNLNFHAPKLLNEFMFTADLGKEEKKKLREHYVNWVNHVVRSYTGSNVHEFTVRFGLQKDYKIHIDQWILFAFKMNVQRLTLDFLLGYCNDRDLYNFPDITDLDAFPHVRHGATSSSSLTSLKLMNTNVSGEVLQFLLSVCPSLECLLVHRSLNIYNLDVRSTSLKSLEFEVCSNLTSLLVTAPNLVSFTYIGNELTLQLNDSPKLTKMSLGGNYCDHFIYNNPLELSNYFSQLEVLMLDMQSEYDADLSNFPILPRLQRLEVTTLPQSKSLLGYASMLRACPALCEFSFALHGDEFPLVTSCESEITVTSPHKSLKVVELIGFDGYVTEHLAIYLIKNAAMLEKIIFDTRDPFLFGSPMESEETQVREAGRRCAQRLVESLCPGATYLII